jgi:hypothetical protein
MAGRHGERCTCDSCIVERASDPKFRATLNGVRLEVRDGKWVIWDGSVAVARGDEVNGELRMSPLTIGLLVKTINDMRGARGGY